ncbi:MAG: hypothetical protein K2H35_00825 [Muribaculaceae bacterium]|nr:hypothetical protein [Muribaculaceae bacterium]
MILKHSIKYLYLAPLLFVAAACINSKSGASADLQPLYRQLDAEIDSSAKYENIKEDRIIRLKKEYDLTTDGIRRTAIIDSLIHEFAAYNADSTLYYISFNLRRDDARNQPGEFTRLMIKRLDQYAHAGFFADALAVKNSIPKDSLSSDSLLEEYYSACSALYQYLSEYTNEHETFDEYNRQRTLYSDSLTQVVKPGSFNHLVYVMSEKARNGHHREAIEGLQSHLKDYSSGSREYSILASTLAYIYKTSGNPDEYKRHLLLSAISDVQGAVKENMSFREAAMVMLDEGEVERAHRYLKKSIADANFYSAMMRNAQSSIMLPVIDDAYTEHRNTLTMRLRIMVAICCALLVGLACTVFFILKQLRRRKEANEKIRLANDELSHLSAQLQDMNKALETRNSQLAEINRTQEEYAGLFMEFCSSAILTLQRYQQSLRVSAAQGGNRAALLKKLESSEISDQLLTDFYDRFDEAILSIYPDFADKFNALLNPGEEVQLKSRELLNTELRLFALIRIGIEDSAKIAQFLRCSKTTVYTYRSKMRKRARRPDDFEQEVKKIR